MVKKYNDKNLKQMNTFGIDAKCNCLIEFEDSDDLKEIFSQENFLSNEWAVIAGGSNIIFDGDFDGILLHPINKKIQITEQNDNQVKVNVGAGAVWDDFVEWAVDNNFWGIENLSDIPGFVGSAPVQNIGAYGVEAKDVIESVETFCVEPQSVLIISKEHCDFGYRDSIFKRALKGKVIITSVNFILSCKPLPNMGYGDLNNKVSSLGGATIKNIRQAVIDIRESKLPNPDEIGNAGSFFKNPIVDDKIANDLKESHPSMPLYPSGIEGKSKLAAGWLIDQAGWKGQREGNVGVHDRQALVLVNHGGATGKEVLSWAKRIQTDIENKFGIKLEFEVNVI